MTTTYDGWLSILKGLKAFAYVFVGGGLAATIPWFAENYGALWFGPLVGAALLALENWVKNRNKGK